jgi:hypothetical protein
MLMHPKAEGQALGMKRSEDDPPEGSSLLQKVDSCRGGREGEGLERGGGGY